MIFGHRYMKYPNNCRFRGGSRLATILLALFILSLAGNFYLIYRARDYRRGANYWLAKYTGVVEEFSRRDVYRDADAALKSDTAVARRIVFFGSQVAERWQLERYFPSYETINRGIGGQWVSGMLLRFWQDVVELHPEYVVIEVSSYNLRPQFSAEQIGQCLQSMVSIAGQNNIKPVLTTMVPIQRGHEKIVDYDNYLVMPQIRAYNEWVRGYAGDRGLALVDFAKILAGSDGYLRDDLAIAAIVPNETGYGMMSKGVNDILGRTK